MKLSRFWILCLLAVMASSQMAQASHVIGADFFQVSRNNEVGNGQIKYDFTFMLYMDCISGQIQAINREDTGIFSLYTGDGRPYSQYEHFGVVKSPSSGKVPANFSNDCINNPPQVCLLRNIYKFTLVLPDNPLGYYLVQNNCCRNETVKNITNPGETGSSYSTYIPPRNQPNNSAVFKNTPPQIICLDNPFVYDHSATDSDGDSLSYEFGAAYDGHMNNNNQIVFQPPPFDPVRYRNPYSAQMPMSGNPPLSIDPVTGMISGTPNSVGRYVVSVHCHEWRNGVMINTVIRDYQFVVTDCSKAVIADIPQYSDEFNTYIVECKDFTVKFDNNSTGGFNYLWDFGVPSLDNDTSNEFSPTYTYPDTGTFVVKLVVNKGSTCPDSIERLVKIYPRFTGYYNFNGNLCPNTPIYFKDSSIGTMYGPVSWNWKFGDGTTDTAKKPIHRFLIGGDYWVTLVSKNSKGCSDTVRQKVEVLKFVPFAGNDTIIVKGVSMQFNAQGGDVYTWMPTTNLSNPDIRNPVGTYPEVGIFPYNVHIVSTENGCEGDDSINVRVVEQASILVPTGFTPNGDGLNDILRPVQVGYSKINYFKVYNRWGEQVFYTTKFKEGWDGTWKGTPADIGVYFWVLSINDSNGQEKLLRGDATLLR